MGQKLVSVSFNMHLPAVILKKEHCFVSHCPALDVASQGNTEEEAKHNLIEAISLFISTCYEMGTLDTVLKECGFVPYVPHDESKIVDDFEYIDVPLPFMIDMGNPNRCLA